MPSPPLRLPSHTHRRMADRIKARTTLQRIVGAVKDQLSTGKAFAKHSQLAPSDLALLRATNHKEHAIDTDAVNILLDIGRGSRMQVSHSVGAIMERLSKAGSWVVALKCLIVINRCLLEGGFMYQDQLSVCPEKGGHNYLNLSNFKDASSPFTWSVSLWIRKYARFIEQWIQTSRTIRYFPEITVNYKHARIDKFCSASDGQLVRDVSALHKLVQEATSCQVEEFLETDVLVKEAVRLVAVTTFSAYEEMKLRLYEAQKRASLLEASHALILLDICEKLSLDSMPLTRMVESIKSSQHDHIATENVFLRDYDLMNLRQSFRLISSSNMLQSRQPDVNDRFALPWRSGSWNASNRESAEAMRFRSRASLSVRRLQA